MRWRGRYTASARVDAIGVAAAILARYLDTVRSRRICRDDQICFFTSKLRVER
jgi:hypothetical protein